jgi:hypothetical protein
MGPHTQILKNTIQDNTKSRLDNKIYININYMKSNLTK